MRSSIVGSVMAGLLLLGGLLAAPAAHGQFAAAQLFSGAAFDVDPPWLTFGNAMPEATFDQTATNAFTVSAAGADLWRATDQYGVVYVPDATPRHFEATVKVATFDGTHASAKAGIMVRNDVTLPGQSTGYLVLSQKGNGEAEFLHDAGGNGQVNDAGEPVATGCGASKTPLWLKVRKQSKTFTAWCSRDGVAWNQVGGPILIPSADAAQDIGMFVSSHVVSTHATAQFTDWSLAAAAPPAPECTPDRSDEFDGDEVDTARWTTVRGTPAIGEGSVTLPITMGDIDGANTGAISYLGQPAPAGAWTATTKVTLEQDNEWQYAGLLLHVDDNNYTKVSFTKHSNDSRFFEFWSENGGARTNHANNVTAPAGTGNTIYVRMVSNGATLTAHYSLDGDTFTQLGNTPAPLKLGARIGPVAAGDTDAQNTTASFDWFRITPDGPRGFDDEFDGSGLDGCRWNRIHNWDGDNVAVQDGNLEITTFDADIDAGNNRAIQNLILQAPPAGDWMVETKMTAPLKDSWQLAGFMLYGDDDHYVKYDVVADNAPGATPARRTELRFENGGPLNGPSGVGPDEPPPASPTDTWYLRLIKTGDTYTGAIRAEGEPWHKTPGSVTLALTDRALGLMAIGPNQDDGPVDVTFDYIRVVENAAPEIASATATPDTGKAPLAGQFNVDATDFDGDALSYSWDFGDGGSTQDAASKDAAFTYATPGTYTATVTVSDGKETDSDTVTVTVNENSAPALTSATATPSSGDAPLSVELDAEATDADGDVLSYSWDFGDGGSTEDASTKDASVSYPAPGTYTATVTVSDGEATDTGSVTVTVTQAPANKAPTVVATADPAGGTAPLAVRFTATGQDPEGGALTYAWSFGDGGTAASAVATHTFAKAGAYAVKVTVTDGKGATGSAALTVVVREAGPGATGNPPAVVLRPAVPASPAAFAKRGVKVTLRCPGDGAVKLTARISKKAAKKLGLRKRVLATAKVTCVAGKTVVQRVKPARKVRKKLLAKKPKALKLTLRLAMPGRDAVERRLTIRR